MTADYVKVASSFDEAVRLLHSMQARQDDHARLMETVMQTLSQVGAGLDALTNGVTQAVATELSATRLVVGDLAGVHSEFARRHAGASAQLASAIEQNTQTSERLSARLRDDIGARIQDAVRDAVGPMGLSVADQMLRLEQAVAHFSQARPAEHRPAGARGDLPITTRMDAGSELSDDLDLLNRNVGASMSAYSEALTHADRAEMVASH